MGGLGCIGGLGLGLTLGRGGADGLLGECLGGRLPRKCCASATPSSEKFETSTLCSITGSSDLVGSSLKMKFL